MRALRRRRCGVTVIVEAEVAVCPRFEGLSVPGPRGCPPLVRGAVRPCSERRFGDRQVNSRQPRRDSPRPVLRSTQPVLPPQSATGWDHPLCSLRTLHPDPLRQQPLPPPHRPRPRAPPTYPRPRPRMPPAASSPSPPRARPSPAPAPARRSRAPPLPAAARGTRLSGAVLLVLSPPAGHRERRPRNARAFEVGPGRLMTRPPARRARARCRGERSRCARTTFRSPAPSRSAT